MVSVNEFWEKYLNNDDNGRIELVMKHIVEPVVGILSTATIEVHGVKIKVPYETRKRIVAEIIRSYFDSLTRYLQHGTTGVNT